MTAPKTFISYSWDDSDHRAWALEFATRLREDGVNATLDRWSVHPGDQLPAFMEQSVRDNDFVLIVCTPKYKAKCDRRGSGGVAFEGDLIQSEVFTLSNHRKFIPILRIGEWIEAAPSGLAGKRYIDLRDGESYQENYLHLLRRLHGEPIEPPEIGSKPDFASFPSAHVHSREDVLKLHTEKGGQSGYEEKITISPAHLLTGDDAKASVNSVAFSPDGCLLATAGRINVTLWDLEKRQIVRSLAGDDEHYVKCLAFSPDGQWLAAATINYDSKAYTVTLWNVATGRKQATLRAKIPFLLNLNALTSSGELPIAFSPDGRYLASGSNGNRLFLWSIPSGEKIDSWPTESYAHALAFSPGGGLLASDSNYGGTISIWDLAARREICTLQGLHECHLAAAIRFTPDGRWLAFAEKTYIQISEVISGRSVRLIKFESADDKKDFITALAVSPNGRWLAAGALKDGVKIWNIQSPNQSAAVIVSDDGALSIAFSPDGRWLATGRYNDTVKLWTVAYL